MGVRHCFSLGLGGAALTVKGKTSGTPDVGFAKSPRTLPPLKRARVASGDRPEPTEAAAETTKTFAWLTIRFLNTITRRYFHALSILRAAARYYSY